MQLVDQVDKVDFCFCLSGPAKPANLVGLIQLVADLLPGAWEGRKRINEIKGFEQRTFGLGEQLPENMERRPTGSFLCGMYRHRGAKPGGFSAGRPSSAS